jgi:enoyl-CoA hydratase/carnithine racemase
VFTQHSPAVFEFKLNAPKTLNSLDTEMCDIMLKKLQTWYKEPISAPRVLMMTGAGEKAFCAGGDIVHLYRAHIDPSKDQSVKKKFFENEYLLDYSLSKMKPF